MKEKLRVIIQVCCLVAVVATVFSFAPAAASAGAGEEVITADSFEGCTIRCRRFGTHLCSNYGFVICP